MAGEVPRPLSRRLLGGSMLAAGLVLLLVAVLGPALPLANYENRPARPWEAFDPTLVREARDMASLRLDAERRLPGFRDASAAERMQALYLTVAERFTHSNGARHTLGTNWILYGAGSVVRPFGLIHDPEVLVAHGHSLVCSQSSYLLMRLALSEGIPARHVGLHGHVVMEAWYDDDWHLFDPDTEAMPRTADGDIPSVEELALDRSMLESTYIGENAQYVDIIASRENNTYMTYPVGTRFEWKVHVLAQFERLAQWLKYVVPLLLVVAGIHSLAGARRTRTLGAFDD